MFGFEVDKVNLIMWYNIGFTPKSKKSSILSYPEDFLGSRAQSLMKTKCYFTTEKILKRL